MRIKLIVIYLIAFCWLTTNRSHAQYPSELKIVHLTDTHICNLDGYQADFVKSRRKYGNGQKRLVDFLQQVPADLDVDAVVITGDMIDFYQAKTTAGTWRQTQVEQFATICEKCPLPLYLTLGNHDIGSYWIENKKYRKSQVHAQQARAAWIRNLACFRNGSYYAKAFTVGETIWHFLFLDNGYQMSNGSILDQPQLDWLQHQVQVADGDPVILFMHIFMPVEDMNADSVRFSKNATLRINEQTCSTGFLKILNEHANIKAIFVGHGHQNVSEMIRMPNGHSILQTETPAFAAKDSPNWRLLTFKEYELLIYKPEHLQEERIIDIR